MSAYASFFLNSNSNIVQLELLEISHPDFSQVYRIVRNALAGVTVTLEDGSSASFDYYPVQIKQSPDTDDLDQKITVTFGDLGEILPQELDAVNSANNFSIKPTLIYRTYRSDDLSAPIYGPLRFELSNLSFDDKGVTFEASAPRLNQLSTGELYALDRFPMLRGFL